MYYNVSQLNMYLLDTKTTYGCIYCCMTHIETVPDVLERSAVNGLVFDHCHGHFRFDKNSTLLGT